MPHTRATLATDLRRLGVAAGDVVGDRVEAQMCARRRLSLRMPVRVALLLQAAFRAVREVEGQALEDGRCLAIVARHFTEVWKPHVRPPRTVSQEVRERDRHRCQVPGCSRPAVHAHHRQARAHGGSDDPSNQIALCAFHHLRAIHGGYLKVTGTAPDRLVWTVKGRPFDAAFFRWRPPRRDLGSRGEVPATMAL